jgi:sRNA-binding regulator protein Hfq
LAEGANVNTEDDFGVTSLMQASQKGSVTLVQILLDRGADVTAKDRNGNTAMMLASRKGHHKVVNLLEEAYKDKVKQAPQYAPKVSSAPNVTQAQSNTKTKENQVALDSGKDIVKASKFSLIQAAEKGHLEEVKRILDEGADGNTKDDDGQTALMKAAKEGHVEIVKLLLNKGANVNSEDNYRRTALMLASFGGHHEVENLLKPVKDEKKNHVKGSLTKASRGIDDLEIFMVNQGNTVIVTANTRSVLCKFKRDADMLILTSKQKDTAAMGDILARGLDLGTIADCPEGSRVYLINGVKNPGYFAGYNEHIMVVRPEGESELYFAFRKAFDHVPVASDEKEKKSK